jgi:hypothetical protein
LRHGWIASNSPRTHNRCRSSEVEHSLGKGEVESSILSGSTILAVRFADYLKIYGCSQIN